MLPYLVLSSVGRTACLHGGVEELPDTRAQVPAEQGFETSGPCSRGRCRDGSATGAETGLPRGGAAGRRVVQAWGMDSCETLPLLPPGAQATLENHLTN